MRIYYVNIFGSVLSTTSHYAEIVFDVDLDGMDFESSS